MRKWEPSNEEMKYLAMAALAGIRVQRAVGGGFVTLVGGGEPWDGQPWISPSRAAVYGLKKRGLISREECKAHWARTEHYLLSPDSYNFDIDWAELLGATA